MKSQGPDLEAFARQFCGCAANEAVSEKVSIAALKRETEAILKDPKHKIADRALLRSFHACAVDVMHEVQEHRK